MRKQELSPDLEATKGAASCSRAAQVRLERPSPVGKNSQRRYCRLSLVLKILIRPFVRREAVLSSKIEGAQATLGELLAAEAGAAVDRSPEDLREVGNYVVALEHGISRLKNLPLCVRFTRELHEKLMTGVKGTMPRQAVSEPFRTGLENPAARSLQRHTSHRLGRSRTVPCCLARVSARINASAFGYNCARALSVRSRASVS